MGEIVFAAKVTHVPTMFASEQPGPLHGCRDAAIASQRTMGDMARAAGADTFVVLDTHWLVNAGYHINNNVRHRDEFTSHEFPQFIQHIDYDYAGNPMLGDAIAAHANAAGVHTRSHRIPTLNLEYGTIVPMRYMNDGHQKVVSIAAWCLKADLEESRTFGACIRAAIEESDSKVALIASGSLSHKIWDNRIVEQKTFEISSEFNRLVDLLVLELWRAGRICEFLAMLPDYRRHCQGEGGMHDTIMLFGALGWDRYTGRGTEMCPYFASSGTGQTNVVFSLPAEPLR
jgi:3,4-dihydroxyphenylacetate 2,3-dioxygenase